MIYTKDSIGSAKCFADEHNIPLGCLRYLMRYYDGDEFSKKLERLLNLNLKVNGKEYNNLQDVLRDYYLPIKSVDVLLNAGVPLESAVNMIVESRRITFRGTSYLSLKHLCKELGLEYKLIKDRCRIGWSLEKAVQTPKLVRVSK